MKQVLISLLLLTIIVLGCSNKKEKPNFVFILVDDLGWTDLSCYGSSFYETPSLDALASEGILFTDAYASCPVCSPTRASIMTGKYPSRLNITDWIPGDDPVNRKLLGPDDLHHLPLEEFTIAEALKSDGYSTFFAGKWHLGDSSFYPGYQGFDINIGGHHRGSPPGGYYSPYKNPMLEDGPEGEYLTDRLTSETISFIESAGEKPFLAFLSFYTVHTPIEANLEYIAYYNTKAEKLGLEGKTLVNEHEGSTMTEQVRPDYASMVAAMDKNVGRIMSLLESKGLDKNTYLIFTSDNGGLSTLWKNAFPPTSVKPLRAGKGWCYEGGIRVPLIIAGPGIKKGKTDSPVISTDFYPTILELAGLKSMPKQHVDGLSLVPELRGNKIIRDAIFWHYPHYHGSTWTPGAAIRMGDWKLVEFYDYEKTELYNLSTDIGEHENLADKEPEKRDKLLSMLRDLQSKTGALFPEINPDFKNHE